MFRVYAEGVFFIMAFTFVCGIAEGILIILLYQVIYGIDIFLNMFKTFLPRRLWQGYSSPAIFTLLNFLERMVHVGESN